LEDIVVVMRREISSYPRSVNATLSRPFQRYGEF
jgi:hypothetical protein